jgi:hypothetical protein
MSLIAHYMLNGDATDAQGTFNGTATNVSWVAGKRGQAGSFNGTNAYVNCGSSAGLAVGAGYTVAAWFNCTNTADASKSQIIYGQWSTGSVVGRLHVFNGSLRFQLRTSAGADVFGGATSDLNTAVSSNIWYHAVATWTGTAGTLYLNRSSVATETTGSKTILTPSANWFIGRKDDSASHYGGLIDDVRIYNHALTASEVLALYNSYSSLLLRRRRTL